MREKPNENDIEVKLKPIAGIRPGVYLTALYSLILLFILFSFLLFPGLKNPGVMLVVTTEPAGAAIRVNDIYRGVSGSRIFVPKGTHTIEAVMPGFEGESAVHEIPSRLFGSLFFPRIYKVEFTLKTTDPAAAFAHYAADFAAWTFMGEPTAFWQIPMSLSEGAYRVGPNKEANEELQEILKASASFAVTQAALRDLIRAKILLDNSGNAPSPTALLGSISDVMAFFSENPDAVQLTNLLTGETAAKIEDSDWYKSLHKKHTLLSPNDVLLRRYLGGARPRQIAGVTFVDIEIGGSFFISENPVNRSLFETFLNENPEWREHKTDYVSDEIIGHPIEINRNNITGITWYAAEAFCKWLSLRLPASMSDMEIRLPTEKEWSNASYVVNNMNSPGWEWCANPYAPLDFITVSPEAAELVGSPERSLYGKALNASSSGRASLPPDLSSPFVTFRLVAAPKK